MVIQSKHFLNTASSLVVDSLRGLCVTNPHLALDAANRVVYLANQDRTKVALLCGGGSGHEPSHSGFVAAVCGSVFASPSSSQVRRAVDLVNNDEGTVIIVKNYTGDVLNFGLAKEQFSAIHPERSDRVKFVIVGDDVAVGRAQGKIVGRRGLAGVCLVYKIAGALAARGGSLDEVYAVAEYVSSLLGTIGVGLEHCHVGHRRVSPVPPLNELIPSLIKMITDTTDPDRSFVPFKNDGTDRVVLLVNNLGGLSELELGAIVGETKSALDKQGITGSFMTSLNMPGFSITLLLLPKRYQHNAIPVDLILSLLDDPTNAPGWKWSSKMEPRGVCEKSSLTSSPASPPTSRQFSLKAPDVAQFNAAIRRACEALLAAEGEITDMDKIAGDGDCGLTLSAGASGVLEALNQGTVTGEDVNMGGTSGALYSIFFSSLAQALAHSSATTVTLEVWSTALKTALAQLYTYTRARPPSRTLIDPLTAFVDTLPAGLEGAVGAVQDAAEKTRDIEAKAGRSAYIEGERLKEKRVPDPGAWGVKVIIEALAK
ncbi:hypothetical protein BU15DRAFT_85598 [Melanogaster broomeanus]|nr:hypothetical protein BU15DRAFT_85598 [Melanogaster broomeanus]